MVYVPIFNDSLKLVIKRLAYQEEIQQKLANNPVVAILGPRQVGKTTLARQIVQSAPHEFFDLEDPIALARLDQPMSALEGQVQKSL